MSRRIGGGHVGGGIEQTITPTTKLKNRITTRISAGSYIEGLKIKLSAGGNFYASLCPSGSAPDGEIMTCEGNSISGYVVMARLWNYRFTPKSSFKERPAVQINRLRYNGGSPTLGNAVVASGGTGYVTDTTNATDGFGRILAKKNPEIDVIS